MSSSVPLKKAKKSPAKKISTTSNVEAKGAVKRAIVPVKKITKKLVKKETTLERMITRSSMHPKLKIDTVPYFAQEDYFEIKNKPKQRKVSLPQQQNNTEKKVREKYYYDDSVEERGKEAPKKKNISPTIILVALLIIVGNYISPKSSAESVVYHPSSCLGGWINPKLAEGPPQIEGNIDAEKFTKENSAILPKGTNADIYCGGFSGEIKRNTKPIKLLLAISWSAGPDIEEEKTIVSDSFASSSLLILDSSSSTPVVFVSTSTSNGEQASSTEGGVDQNITPDIATSTDEQVQQESTSTSIVPIETQEKNTQTKLLPTLQDNKEEATSTQGSGEMPAPAHELPTTSESVIPEVASTTQPLSLIKSIFTTFAFGSSMRAYADEIVATSGTSSELTTTATTDHSSEVLSQDGSQPIQEGGAVDTILKKTEEIISQTIQLPEISNSSLEIAPIIVPTTDGAGSSEEGVTTKTMFTTTSTSTNFSTSSILIDEIKSDTTLSISPIGSIITQTRDDDDSPSNFLEIMYTFDGVVWSTLGKVSEESMVYRTFEIPMTATTSWDDLASLQVKVKYIGRLDPPPATIYLDGIKVEVLYDTPTEHEHPDFTRDTILKDKSDDNIRVVSIINSDTNNKELWYTTIRDQEGFGVSPGSWVKIELDQEHSSYRLIEIYGRYLFWVDDVGKMLWTMNLEKNVTDGVLLNSKGTTTIPFIKPNGENWFFDYNNVTKGGLLRIQE